MGRKRKKKKERRRGRETRKGREGRREEDGEKERKTKMRRTGFQFHLNTPDRAAEVPQF